MILFVQKDVTMFWSISQQDRPADTYIQQLRVGEHALFQTRSEEIDVILHQFVDRPLVRAGSVALCDLGGFEPGHERRPIGLDDFRSAKVQ